MLRRLAGVHPASGTRRPTMLQRVERCRFGPSADGALSLTPPDLRSTTYIRTKYSRTATTTPTATRPQRERRSSVRARWFQLRRRVISNLRRRSSGRGWTASVAACSVPCGVRRTDGAAASTRHRLPPRDRSTSLLPAGRLVKARAPLFLQASSQPAGSVTDAFVKVAFERLIECGHNPGAEERPRDPTEYDGENAGTWEPRRQDNVQHGEIDLARGRRRLNTVRSPYRPLQGRADPFTYEGDLRNKTRMRCAAVTCQVIARSARAARP